MYESVLRVLGTIMTCFTSFVNPIICLFINALVSSTNFSQTKNKTREEEEPYFPKKGDVM